MSTITRMLPALKILRDRGIVHRDIKLENVMLCRTGDTAAGLVLYKLLDWGFAARVHSSGEGPCLFGGTAESTALEYLIQPSFEVHAAADW